MNFLEKLQNLPPYKKKIILWSVVVSLGAVLFIVWIISVKNNIEGFKGKEIRIINKEAIKKENIDLPEFEVPEEMEEQLEKALKTIEKETEDAEEKQ